MKHFLVWYIFSDKMMLKNYIQKKTRKHIFWMGQTNTGQKKHTCQYTYIYIVYTWICLSFFGSKKGSLRGKKDTSFWGSPPPHTQTHVYIYIRIILYIKIHNITYIYIYIWINKWMTIYIYINQKSCFAKIGKDFFGARSHHRTKQKNIKHKNRNNVQFKKKQSNQKLA